MIGYYAFRDLRFAGDTGLAQSAAVPLKAEMDSHVVLGLVQMGKAFLLVVTGLGDRAYRTAGHALSTGSASKEETVRAVIRIGSRRRLDGKTGYDRTCPHGFSFRGD